MAIKYFFKIFYLKYIQDDKDCIVELSLTITSIQMIPYEKVIYFKYTKSTFKTADTSWENFEECIQKILFSLYLVAFIFLFFIDRGNDIILKYSKGLRFCNSFLLFYKHQICSTLYHLKIKFLFLHPIVINFYIKMRIQ